MKKPNLKEMMSSEKIKAFIKKYVLNNIGYKILSLAFAFILWLVVLNITDPEYTRTFSNITVEILNEDAVSDNGRHVYTITSGETTSVIVTGKRSIISSLSPSSFSVTADFQELSITNAVPINVSLTGDKARYTGQVILTTRDTSMIINWENMVEKTIPVELEYTGTLAEDLVIDEANISTKKVTINAPESIAQSAEKAVITINASTIDSDVVIETEPIIKDQDGNTVKTSDLTSLDVETIEVELKVSHKKEVPIVVNGTGQPGDGYTFELELSPDSLTVKGTEEDIDSFRAITIPSGVIDISGAIEDYSAQIDVTDYLPEGIVVYGESPLVTVTINFSSNEAANEEQTDAPELEQNVSEITSRSLSKSRNVFGINTISKEE